MEVPGRKTSSDQMAASARHTSVLCQPCVHDGKQVPAKSYCTDCKEYLCKQCCDYQKKFTVLRQHKLSDIGDTHVSTRKKQGSKPTINCKLHPDKLIEFYCRKHNVTVCGACAVIDHMSCQPQYIPDISLDYKHIKVFKDYNTHLESLLKSVTHFLQYAENSIKGTMENGQRHIAEIKRYREEINQYLDRKEKELEDEIDKLRNADLKKLHKKRVSLMNIRETLPRLNPT